jgi:hypothetical protein
MVRAFCSFRPLSGSRAVPDLYLPPLIALELAAGGVIVAAAPRAPPIERRNCEHRYQRGHAGGTLSEWCARRTPFRGGEVG